MRRTPLTVVVLVFAILALPAASLAQSAGDDQYNDPLKGQHSGGHSGSKGSGGNTSTPPPTTAPATQTPAASSAATPGSQTSTVRSQLPRTGFDVILTIELGIAMLLTGVVVQRLVVLRDRRETR
jgi:hypothetical protein